MCGQNQWLLYSWQIHFVIVSFVGFVMLYMCNYTFFSLIFEQIFLLTEPMIIILMTNTFCHGWFCWICKKFKCICNFDNYPGILSKMPIHCEIHFFLCQSLQYMSYSFLCFFLDTFHAVLYLLTVTCDAPALIANPLFAAHQKCMAFSLSSCYFVLIFLAA